MENNVEKKKNKCASISFILALCAFPAYIVFSAFFGYVFGSIMGVITALAASIVGIVAIIQIKKDDNKKGKTTAIGGTVGALFLLFILSCTLYIFLNFDDPEITAKYCVLDEYVEDCVEKEDNTSVCQYAKTIDIVCKTELLKPEQFREK